MHPPLKDRTVRNPFWLIAFPLLVASFAIVWTSGPGWVFSLCLFLGIISLFASEALNRRRKGRE
jgi:hypothetical protein